MTSFIQLGSILFFQYLHYGGLDDIILEGIYNSSDSNEVKYLRIIEMNTQVYERYIEASNNILPPDQAELYNAGLIKQLEQYEKQKVADSG